MAVMEASEGLVSPLGVNFVFQVDGRLLPAVDFEGVRTGRYSRKSALLMVQAAVPREPQDDRRGVLMSLLREAVDEAEAFARRRKSADALPVVRSVDALPAQ